MKRLTLFLVLLACVATAQIINTNISRYPRTNFVATEGIFIFSATNVSTNQSFGITASNLFYQITNGLVTGTGDAGGTNARQFGSLNLTNWSNLPTGAMANVVAVTFLTNWTDAISNYVTAATNAAQVTNWINFRQPADTDLTNWALIPTGAMANVVSTTFLTNWANAVSNYVTAATNSASVTNWINSRQPASANLTNWSQLPTNEMASVFFVESNALPVFPNLARQMLNGKPQRLGWLGDSIGNLTMEEVVNSLVPFHGRNGAALYGANFLAPTLGSTATNVTRATNWFITYQDIGSAGVVTYSNNFSIWTWADRLGCEFMFQTNGGTFKLQLQTNGGAFTDVLTGIATGTASTNLGGVTNHAMLPGYYCARVVHDAGGLVSVFGIDLWATNQPGVRVSYLNAAGTTMQDMAAVPSSITEPILRHLNLDLMTLEGTADPTVNIEAAVSNLNYRSFRTLTNTDIAFLGTTPIDPSFLFDYATFNAAYRKVAAANSRFYLDQSIISGTFSNMQHMGWSGDGLHRSNNLSRLCASALMQKAKLFDTTMDNEGRLLARSNMFTGPVTVSNVLWVAGFNSSLKIADRTAFVPSSPGAVPYSLDVYSDSAGTKFGFATASFQGYGLQMHNGYGPYLIAYPGAGSPLGVPDFPFGVMGTNIVDMSRHVIQGTGNGNTNYTLHAGSRRMYCGSSNINIVAVMGYNAAHLYSATPVHPWVLYATNLSPITWGFGVQATTNRWRWHNMHTGGTNAPSFFTNNTLLRIDGESNGTNIFARWFNTPFP